MTQATENILRKDVSICACRVCGGVPTYEVWDGPVTDEADKPSKRHSIWCFGETDAGQKLTFHHHNEITSDSREETERRWNRSNAIFQPPAGNDGAGE